MSSAGSQLTQAIGHNQVDVVRRLETKQGAKLATVQTDDGWTALHYAASLGRTGCTKLLLEVGGADLAKVQNATGWTALHCAAARGHGDCIKLLLEVGGADLAKVQNDWGWTPLHCAADHGHTDCIRQLLEVGGGAELAKLQDSIGYTALHFAAEDNAAASAQLLLQAGGKELAKLQSENGWTALHLAVDGGHTDCVRLLLEAGGVELAKLCLEHGWTALHLAAHSGNTHCTELLLGNGSRGELAQIQNHSGGHTPLHIAAGCGYTKCVMLLLAAGSPDVAWVLDSGGRSALHWAVNSLECSRLLLDAAPGLIHANSNGTTPLHALCLSLPITNTNFQVAKLLVERGASVTSAVLEAACQSLGISMEVVAEGDPCLQLCLLLAKELCRTQPQLLCSHECPKAVREVAVLLLPALVAAEAAAREELSSYRAGEAERTRGAQDLLVQAAAALKGLQRRRQDCDL